MGEVHTEEPPVIVTDRAGRQWVRRGYCSRCGQCCKGDPFDNRSLAEYCPLFRWVEAGKGMCCGRNTDYYLNACKSWPSRPEHVADKPLCTYTYALSQVSQDSTGIYSKSIDLDSYVYGLINGIAQARLRSLRARFAMCKRGMCETT